MENPCSIENCDWSICREKSDLPKAQLSLHRGDCGDARVDDVIDEVESVCRISECDWQPCTMGNAEGLAGQALLRSDQVLRGLGSVSKQLLQ